LLCESATSRYSRRKISTDYELSGLGAHIATGRLGRTTAQSYGKHVYNVQATGRFYPMSHEEYRSLGSANAFKQLRNRLSDEGYHGVRYPDDSDIAVWDQKAIKIIGHSTKESISERWIDQPVTSVTDDGPASSLNANQSPQEMAKLMLANNQDKDKPTILRYMQYLLNHSTYKMSPEFRGKVRSAMRIIAG
jgi:hypothetical protein